MSNRRSEPPALHRWEDDGGRPHACECACQSRVAQLEEAIRKHRDQRGDDRCWLDDEELYRMLPEGYTPPPRDSSVELALCQQFIQARHHPATEYVSPQRRIEELEAQIRELTQALNKENPC